MGVLYYTFFVENYTPHKPLYNIVLGNAVYYTAFQKSFYATINYDLEIGNEYINISMFWYLKFGS